MTITTALAPLATDTLTTSSPVTDAATRRLELDALEATGLQLIDSAALKMLATFSITRNINHHAGRLDRDAVESAAVRYLAIFLARFGTEDVARMARGAAKKACNLVASSAQSGRNRSKVVAETADYTIGALETADQANAVAACVKASNLSTIQRGYAHNSRTLRGTWEGAEGMSHGNAYRAALSAALVDELGADTLEALHEAYTPEIRSTRGGSANAVGTIRRNRSIAWADAAPEGVDRGTFRYRVQTAAAAALVTAKNA